jgi:glycosyltransferase involved in cell wall biosynthesis
LDRPDLFPLFAEFDDMPLVSISDSQRRPLAGANWAATVYHGLPENLYQFHPNRGKYFAFLGRMSPEKRPDRAIEIATALGIPLKFAAKVDKPDREYFDEVIKPKLDDPLIEFFGEIGEEHKDEFLGNALALLFPIDWPEPFGLVMIEAFACGTPVVAFGCGSVPEILENGKTGFVVGTIEEAIEATRQVESLDRRVCRAEFERRFTVRRMAEDYARVYRSLREPLDVQTLIGPGTGIKERLSA